MTQLNDKVAAALDELAITFQGAKLITEPDGAGGTRVCLEPVVLGEPFQQAEIWIGAHLPAQLPYADVYPLFVSANLTRLDQGALGEGLSAGHTFMSRPSVQVSRRSNNVDFENQTAAMKFQKVLQWLKEL